MNSKRYTVAGILAVLILSLAGSAFGQTGNALLGGTVQDPSKALIPGVTISAKNEIGRAHV